MHPVGAQLDQPPSDAAVAQYAARQHGVVSRRQLVAAGLGRRAIERRVRIGWLHRMYRGVYSVGHPPLTREARWMGAVLVCGDGAGLSHACATARTLLDVATTLSDPALARTVEQTEIRRLFDLRAIEGMLARHPNHPGRARLTRAIELYRDDELTRSELEAIFCGLCDDHALPRPLVNHIIENDEVDFFWPHQRLVVETDGRGTHLTRAAFERDRDRDARLVALGYRVLRFTERQVTADTEIVAARLSALLPTSASR